MVCISIILGLILIALGSKFTWWNEANLVCSTGAYQVASDETHEMNSCSMNKNEASSFVHFTCLVENDALYTSESSTEISIKGAYKLTFLTEQYGYMTTFESQTKRTCDRSGECRDDKVSCSCLKKGWTTNPVTSSTSSLINYCDKCQIGTYLDIPSDDALWGDTPATKLGSVTKYADNVPLGDGTLRIAGEDISLIKNQPVISVANPIKVIEKNSFSLASSEYCGTSSSNVMCYHSVVKRQDSFQSNYTSSVGVSMGDLRMTVQAYGSNTISALGTHDVSEGVATITAGSFGRSKIPPCQARSLIYLIDGTYSASEIYEKLQSDLDSQTELFRILSFLLIGLGFHILFSPVQSGANRIPLIGSCLAPLVGFVMHIFTALVTGTLWFTVFALAWVFYRPVYGTLFLIIAGSFSAGAYKLYKKNAYDKIPTADRVIEMESIKCDKEIV